MNAQVEAKKIIAQLKAEGFNDAEDAGGYLTDLIEDVADTAEEVDEIADIIFDKF